MCSLVLLILHPICLGDMDDSQMSSSSHSKDQDKVEETSYTDQSSPSHGSRHASVTDYATVKNGSCTSPTCFDFTDQPEVDAGQLDDTAEQRWIEVGSDEELTGGQSSEENLQGVVPDSQMHTFVDDTWEDLSGCFGKGCLKIGLTDLHKGEVSCNSPSQNTSSMADSAYEDGESEAEKSCRAQDQSISSANTDNDFPYYQQSDHDSPTIQLQRDSILEKKRKTEEDLPWGMQKAGVTSKGPEDLIVNHSVQEMSLIHLYKHDYSSFSPVAFTGVIGGLEGMKAVDVSPGVTAQAQSTSGDIQVKDKTEISIMEATMDNNEWLTGNEGHSNFPWLSQSDGGESSSMAEESQQDIEWDTEKSEAYEELSAVYTSSDDDDDLAMKRVATVPPMLQMVRVTFSVHYITDAPNQLLAVTGNQQELGGWQSFVPLQRSKNGFWANTVTFPVERQVEWKFVLVEDGKICRWEECSNRHLLLTGREEDLYVLRWWGCL